ncbi:MAG: hypothetical protein ACOX4H_01240 [Bacillota bacterium]|jgi:hypothetical protein|nr:hypothetical protein [Clostridia bacterium]
MILITITNAREKFYLLLKIALLVLLLGLIVPKLYAVLSDAGSLHRFAEKEQLPEEPMRVEQVETEIEGSPLWTRIVNSFK